MFRYLKAAFWARPEITGLGRVPANAAGVMGFAILGIGHPAFWLLGLGIETLYLFGLATNPRFQKWVDAGDRQVAETDLSEQQQDLIAHLPDRDQAHLEKLRHKCDRIEELQRLNASESFVFAANRDALQRLLWLYLKLLVAKNQLQSADFTATERGLRQQIDGIEEELRLEKLSRSLKQSKEATLKILRQRLSNLGRREQTLEEIDSDLTRIEAQIDLAVENAMMRGKPETISANINLVSTLLDDAYGDAAETVASLDSAFGMPARASEAQ